MKILLTLIILIPSLSWGEYLDLKDVPTSKKELNYLFGFNIGDEFDKNLFTDEGNIKDKEPYEDVITEGILENKINPKDLDLKLHKISPMPDKECKEVKAENFNIKSFLVENDIWLDKRYLYPNELKSFQFYYLVDNIAYKKEIINQNNDQIALQIFCLGVPNYEYENRIILTQLYYNWKNDNPPTNQEILEFKNDAKEIRLNGELRYFNGSIIALAEKKDGSDIGVYVYKPLEKKWKKSKLIDYKNLFNSPELLPPPILTEFENTGNGWKIMSNFKGDDFNYYN